MIFFKLDNLDERVEIQYLHSKGLASMNIQTDMAAKHRIGSPLFATMNAYVSKFLHVAVRAFRITPVLEGLYICNSETVNKDHEYCYANRRVSEGK